MCAETNGNGIFGPLSVCLVWERKKHKGLQINAAACVSLNEKNVRLSVGKAGRMPRVQVLILYELISHNLPHIRPSPLVLLRAEVLPLRLHLAVHFQFGVAFGVFEAELLVYGDEVGE